MRFSVLQNANGTTDMSWDAADNIMTNVFTSIETELGKMFNKTKFGLKLDDIKKITNSNIDLIKQRYENSIKWLVDIGKAKSYSVFVEEDKTELNRVNVNIQGIEADGTPYRVSIFRTVGGPS